MNPPDSSAERYTVTAALPYANGPLHIGHLAGCYLPADIYVRFLRRTGADVLFICGSDEHGVPITLRAEQEKISPQQVVDRYHALLNETFQALHISFDIYHRTSSPLHHKTAQAFFLDLYQKGELLEQTTEEFYDEKAGRFLADRYVMGTCPACGYDQAYGDQCEKCGRSLSPRELIKPRSRLSGTEPVLRSTRHWYLDLGKHQDMWLKDWILSHKDIWKTNVWSQCMSWLGEGDNHLKPRAVTRDLDWGVPVPADVPGAEGKVIYVWFEAPLGYISATKAYFEGLNKQREDSRPRWVKGKSWEDYWKKQGNSRIVHFIGKDNIVFHCIVFPAMLRAAGEFQLPWQVPANEFLNLEGHKISTSRNYAVWVHEFLQEMPDRVDELRYVLAASMPEQRDNNFTWRYDGTDNTTGSFQARVNNELVANLGNFVNRIVVLTHKYYGGHVPASPQPPAQERLQECRKTLNEVAEALHGFRFRDALSAIMKLSAWGNRFLQRQEPWKTFNTQPDRTAFALYEATQVAALLGYLCEPFMPGASRRILTLFGLDTADWMWPDLFREELVAAGTSLGPAVLLFRKVEDAEIRPQLEKLQNLQTNVPAASVIPQENQDSETYATSKISLEDFKKIRLVVARVVDAEKVPKADKLLKLTLDIGNGQCTVLSGIAQYYAPEQVKGRRVVLLENLEPRMMRGIESQGMILMADGPEGKPVFLEPAEEVKPGSPIH